MSSIANSQIDGKDHDYMFKLVLLGSSGVGKSNILLRLTRNQFIQQAQSTIGVQYATKIIQTENKKRIKFQIWDTAGQEQYKALMKTFYKGSSAALLVYDITDEKTFHDLDYWYKNIKQFCKSQIVIMLVGNKTDLQANRKISKQDGLSFAEKNRVAFYEVSAKTGSNIQLIFGKIAQQLQKIMEQADKSKQQSLSKTITQTKQSVANGKKQQSPLKIKKTETQKKNEKKSCCK